MFLRLTWIFKYFKNMPNFKYKKCSQKHLYFITLTIKIFSLKKVPERGSTSCWLLIIE